MAEDESICKWWILRCDTQCSFGPDWSWWIECLIYYLIHNSKEMQQQFLFLLYAFNRLGTLLYDIKDVNQNHFTQFYKWHIHSITIWYRQYKCNIDWCLLLFIVLIQNITTTDRMFQSQTIATPIGCTQYQTIATPIRCSKYCAIRCTEPQTIATPTRCSKYCAIRCTRYRASRNKDQMFQILYHQM